MGTQMVQKPHRVTEWLGLEGAAEDCLVTEVTPSDESLLLLQPQRQNVST